MSDPRPADQPQHDALRARLEAWLNRQNQSLLEEVMASWQKGLEHFHPDAPLLEALVEAVPAPAAPPSDGQHLAAALDLLEGATSQSDLLKRLLDALALMADRCALYILKQGQASLYAHRGFEAESPAKADAVPPPPELEALILGSVRSLREKGPAYSALVSPLSPLEAAEGILFPLLHKRRTVAVVLVDSGQHPLLQHPEQVRALTLAASAILGLLAAGKEEEARPKVDTPSPAAPLPAAPIPAVPISAPVPTPAAPPRTSAPPRPAQPIARTETPELDPKTRAAAERLARVLVGDVDLYFPAKVAQARAQGNLFQLLRPELERSRATFVERFGEDVENKHRIFTTTLIQLLCDGDTSKLGPAPWA